MKKNKFGSAPAGGVSEEELKRQAQAYSKMSEDELTAQMFRVAKEEKAAGRLDAAALDNFYRSASAMLTQEQREKLRKLIDTLRSV